MTSDSMGWAGGQLGATTSRLMPTGAFERPLRAWPSRLMPTRAYQPARDGGAVRWHRKGALVGGRRG